MAKRLLYPQLTKPITPPGSEKERVSLDKFDRPFDIPIGHWKKAALYSCAAIMPYLALGVPLARVPVVNQEPVVVTAPRTTQYQMRAIPPYQPVGVTVTVDKWYQAPNQPLFKQANISYTYPVAPIDPVQLTLKERTTPDKWLGYHPDYLFDIKRLQALSPYLTQSTQALTVTERITPDKWLGYHPDFIFDVKRNQFLYPTTFNDGVLTFQPQKIFSDKYTYEQALPVFDLKRTQYLYPAMAPIDPVQMTAPERVSLDKWHLPQSLPRFDIARVQYLAPASSFSPQPITTVETITADKWTGYSPPFIPDVKRQQFDYPYLAFTNVFPQSAPVFPQSGVVVSAVRTTLYQSRTFVPLVTAPAEIITPDKWLGYHPDILPDIKRVQYLGQSFFFAPSPLPNAEVITLDKWQGNRTEIVFDVRHAQYLYQTFTTDPNALTIPERITPDKWSPVYPDFIPDMRRQQFVAPTNFPDPFLGFIPDNVEVDKYDFNNDQPIFRAPNISYTYPVAVQDAYAMTLPENAAVDKWMPAPNQPVFTRPPLNPTVAIQAFVQLVIIEGPVTMDKWYQTTQQPRFDVTRRQEIFPAFMIDPTAFLKGTPIIPPPRIIFVDGRPAMRLSSTQYIFV